MSESSPSGATCPKCGVATAPGAVFCGGCGQRLSGPAAGAASGPPQPPPTSSARFSAGAASPDNAIQVEQDQAGAYQQAVGALQSIGATLTWQSPPSAAKFVAGKRNLMATSGIKVNYTGDLVVTQTGPRQSQVRLIFAPDWSSFMPVLILSVVATLIVSVLSGPLFTIILLIGVLGTAWGIYYVAMVEPKKLAGQVFLALGGAPAYAPPAAPPVPTAHAPAAAAPPPPPPATPPAGAAPATDDVFAQLKKLAELRDMGAITTEDFDAKKADLLTRL